MDNIIFKIFRTYKHPYLYDRHTNSLAILSENEYKELEQVEQGNLSADESPVIKRYQSFGMLMPNVVKRIEHSGTIPVETYLDTRAKQLTLQVTQQCNLRCGYCIYSGIYTRSRSHANKRMSWDTAKKAIDFFLRRNIELPEIIIGFYGGEPLLEFDLIKKCVEYVESIVEGKKVFFNITTNGTLLTDEVVDFFVEKDFKLSISLDGSQKEHDVNRKFRDGSGSFNTIINNIKRIKTRYPQYNKKITIMTTVNPYMDLGCVLEFFDTDEVLDDKYIMFNSMKETSLEQAISYDDKHFCIRNYEYIKLLFSLVGKLNDKYVSQLVKSARSQFENLRRSTRRRAGMLPVTHPGGPCLPGVRRLFVRVDGALFPCERVSDALEFYQIGTLDNGYNLSNIRRLLNIGQLTENECKTCWCLSHCSLCSEQIDFKEAPTREDKLRECPNNWNRVFSELYELCVLNEFGYETDDMKVIK